MTFELRRRLPLLVLASLLLTPLAAEAQISGPTPAPGVWGWPARNTVAYDPVHEVYLTIPFQGVDAGAFIWGRWIDKNGSQVGFDFQITDELDGAGAPAYTAWASIVAGGPANDRAFLITYLMADGGANPKFARLIRYQPGVGQSVSPARHIADVGGEWNYSEKAQNSWNGERFIIGTRLIEPGYSLPAPAVTLLDMALNYTPPTYLGDNADYYGSPAMACASPSVGVCVVVGFKSGISSGYSGGTYGRLFSATTLSPLFSMLVLSPVGPNEDQGVIYMKHTGMFLAQWMRGSGGNFIDTRLLIPDGSLGPLDLSRGVGPGAGTNAFAYNSKTQTTLLLTKDNSAALWALELGDDGYPIRPANLVLVTEWDGGINDYLPSVAANEEDGQWLIVAKLVGGAFGKFVHGTPVDPTQVPLTVLTAANLPAATVTLPVSQLLLASGGVIPYTWSFVSGTLPPGVGLNGMYISGTPTTAGTYNFRLRVTSTDLQVAERDFTMVVLGIIQAQPGPPGANISPGLVFGLPSGRVHRNNLAYDSVQQVFLMIVERGDVGIWGRFTDRNGNPVGSDFIIANDIDPNTGGQAYLGWPSIAFGGPAGNPVFLVTYLGSYGSNPKYARYVRYMPGGAPAVTAPYFILNVGSEWLYAEKATSFWTGQHFVVGSRAIAPGASLPTPQVNTINIFGTVSPPVYLGDGADYYGSPAVACATNDVCLAIGFKAGMPTGFTGGTYARRFNANSLAPIGPLTALANNNPNEDQGVVYQAHTGHFLAQWFRGGGAGYIDTRLVGTDGAMSLLDLSRGIGPGAGNNAISYNPATMTSLLVTKLGAEASLFAIELGDNGYPVNAANTVLITTWDGINDYLPAVAANTTYAEWMATANMAGGMAARIVIGSPASTQYTVQNGTFAGGTTGWSQFALPDPSDFVVNVNNGVLEFYRLPLPPGTTGQGVVLQALGLGLPAGAPIAANFDLGNSSSVRKRITVILHDLNFGDLQICSFWLDAGAPLRTYRMRTHTTQTWTNATIAFYAASTGSDGGAYRLDNVQVYALQGQAVDRTECVDPTTPLAVQIADSATILTNGDFSAGLAPWGTFGQITHQISGGVFEFARPAGTPAGVVLQATGVAQANDTRLTATFSLGNSSGVRRRVTAIIHDFDFTDLAACTFWLAPGQPLSTYTMKFFTTDTWENTTFALYPSDVNEQQWIQLDNVSLRITPSATLTGSECIEPPQNLAPGALKAAAAAAAGAPGAAAQDAVDRDQPLWQAVAGETGTQTFVWASPIDLRETATPVLQFESMLTDGPSQAYVEVTRDGVNWMRAAAIAPSDDWTDVSVDLAAFSGDVVYLRFVYAGAEPVGGAPVEAWAIRAVRIDVRAPRTIQRFR
jgi:hypothetical protein